MALRLIVCAVLALLLPGVAHGADFLLGPPPSDGPVEVRGGVFLSDVNAVTEQEETFEFEGILTLSWRDARQRFDPAEVGVSEKVYQGNYQFAEVFDGWWPQVFLVNESGDFESQAVLLSVQPDGSLTLIQEFNAVVEMPMNLRRFPFDRQHFEAVFQVLGFGPDRVRLVPDPGATGSADRPAHIAQWVLHGVRVSVRENRVTYADGRSHPASQLVFTLDLAREPDHLLRLVVVPLALLVVLTFSVFWMDRESLGDRMDISFIGVLSLVAYQIVMSDQMPAIAYFTLMHGFLYSTYLLLAAGVGINLLVSKLDQAGHKETGNRIDVVCRWAFPLAFVGLNALNALYFLAFH
jgi:hypothetical protein